MLFAFVVLTIVVLLGGQAQAVTIPAASSVGPPPPGPGTGLNGEFHDTDVADAAAGEALVIGPTMPTATFTSTAIDYPNGIADTVADSTVLGVFLGVDVGSLSPPLAGITTLDDSVFGFTGFIKITGALDVTFSVGSDDGFRLRIGGVVVAENIADRPFGFTTGVANFEAEGLYPFVLTYVEEQENTGVEACSSIPGGTNPDCPTGTAGIIPTAVLFQTVPPTGVPAPPTLWILATGIVGLIAAHTIRCARFTAGFASSSLKVPEKRSTPLSMM